MSFQRLRSIMRKEIRQILRDRRTLGTIITLPILQLVLYGYLSTEVLHQPTVVWDQSNSAESRALVAAFENTRYFTVRYWARDLKDVERQIDGGLAKIGLVMPPDYAPLVRAGRPAQVLAIVDASDATSARVVLSVSEGVGSSLSQAISLQLIQRQGGQAPTPLVEVRTRAWYNPNLRSAVFILPGVIAVILQFTTTFLSISVIVREREIGTLEQIVVTPIHPAELLLGKILPLIALGFINFSFTLFLAWVWFGVAVKGSVLLLYLAVLAFFFSSLGIGTLLSTVAKSFQQATQLAQLILLPSILISGFLFPRESLPIALQYAGLALPLTHFVIVVRGLIIKGVGIAFLWQEVLLLVGLGIVVFALAMSRFQKKID